MRELYHSLAVVPALASASQAAAGDGLTIDLKGFDSVLFAVSTGAIAGSGDFGVKVQESDLPGSGFTDVAAADLIGAFPATLAANGTYRVAYITSKMKRYVRLSLTKAGGTSIQMAAVAILGHPDKTLN